MRKINVYNKFKNLDKSRIKFLISPIIVLFLITIVYFINDVYPFGKNTLVNGDFGKAYLPIYYYMYDLFNGNESIFINFKVGLGTDMYDLISIYGILSPVNWLLTLTSRSNIPNFMSYLFVIRLCLLSVTSFFMFDKVYKKLNIYWKILFSVLYAFSGWVIVYHTNFVWLDNVILFPILLLGFKKIIDNGDYRLYTIILFLSIIYSFYIAYMELLFILFLSFGYLVFLCKEEDKKMFIYKLGIGTILTLGLALVFVLPTIVRIFNSVRASIDFGKYLFGDMADKLMIVLFYGLPIILFMIMLKSKRGNKKIRRFYLYLFIIFLVGVIFNPINLMWHTGSYAEFPYRYSFIVVMVLYLGALYYLQFNESLQFKKSKNYYIYIFLIFIFLIYLFTKHIPVSAASDPSLRLGSYEVMFNALLISILGLFLVYSILLLRNVYLKYSLLVLFLGVCCIGWSLSYIGISSPELSKESTNYSFNIGNNLYNFLKDDINEEIRYKNLNVDMIENYGFILSKSTISNWHMNDSNSSDSLDNLGYATPFTSTTDRGGTLFTDNLLGINRYISNEELDSRVYNLIDNDNNVNLYELNSFLGYGLVFDSFNYDEGEDNLLNYQNEIYQKLFNKEDSILEDIDFEFLVDSNSAYLEENDICAKEDTEFSFYLTVSELSELYFDYDSIIYVGKDKKKYKGMDKLFQINYIKVNDGFIYNSNVNDSFNKKFISSSGIVDLGAYEDKKIKVTMSLYKDFCIKDFEFSKINIKKMNDLIIEYKSNVEVNFDKNKLFAEVNAEGNNKNLFLPINYSSNYNCEVNGKKVKIEKILDNFVSIPLSDGANKVVLTYYPSYLKESGIISIISLLLLLIFVKFKFVPNSIILKIFNCCYYLVFLGVFFYIYVYGFIN